VNEQDKDVVALNGAIEIKEQKIQAHLDAMVRATVEAPLNALLDAEADRLCRAKRYEHTAARLRHVTGTRWGTKKYMDNSRLTKMELTA
jgi:transposase-like protein